MVTPYGAYGDDAGATRYGHGYAASNYNDYGARQAAQARQYASGAMPCDRPESPFYPPPNASSASLRPEGREVRPSRGRPRSLPPPARRQSWRHQQRSPSNTSRESEDPIRKAHGIFKETFSNSTSGLGVGVLGAIVGGLVAREATEATSRPKSHGRRRSYREQDRARLLSTVLGAAVGGFGANAIEKRIELAREKNAEMEKAWEKKWHRDSKGRRVNNWDEGDFEEGRGRRRNLQRSRDVYTRRWILHIKDNRACIWTRYLSARSSRQADRQYSRGKTLFAFLSFGSTGIVLYCCISQLVSASR